MLYILSMENGNENINKIAKMDPVHIQVLNLLSRGYTQKMIGQMVGHHYGTIHDWIEKYAMKQLIREMSAFPVYVDALRELAHNLNIAIQVRSIEMNKWEGEGEDRKFVGDSNVVLKACAVIHNLIQPFLEKQQLEVKFTFSNEVDIAEIFSDDIQKNQRAFEATTNRG